MIIAIDFDGTIVDHNYPKIGNLKSNVKEVINKLYENHIIIIWTCRFGKDKYDMINFLDKEGIRYHYINENDPNLDFQPFPKIYYDILIDDRNLFTNKIDWLKIEEEINNIIKG